MAAAAAAVTEEDEAAAAAASATRHASYAAETLLAVTTSQAILDAAAAGTSASADDGTTAVPATAPAHDDDARRRRSRRGDEEGGEVTLDSRGPVFFTGNCQTFPSGNRLVYGGTGEVVGPATGEEEHGRRRAVPGEQGPRQLLPLPAQPRGAPAAPGRLPRRRRGLLHGERVTFPSGKRMVYGDKGEVVGPATGEKTKGIGLVVQFPGNKALNCLLTDLSRLLPPARNSARSTTSTSTEPAADDDDEEGGAAAAAAMAASARRRRDDDAELDAACGD